MVSCQKGPTRHAYALHIGLFWQDTLDIWDIQLALVAGDANNLYQKDHGWWFFPHSDEHSLLRYTWAQSI